MTTSPSAEAQARLDGSTVAVPGVRSLRSPRKLPYIGRIIAGILAWILLIVGLAGLVLPGLQGVLILALSVTFFSLTSRRVHERLRSAFRPWPKGWRRVVKLRRSLERWLGRFHS